ncbi:hypothetical protein CYMTET_22102, partial [Cymbomonas tetramitiformis]
ELRQVYLERREGSSTAADIWPLRAREAGEPAGTAGSADAPAPDGGDRPNPKPDSHPLPAAAGAGADVGLEYAVAFVYNEAGVQVNKDGERRARPALVAIVHPSSAAPRGGTTVPPLAAKPARPEQQRSSGLCDYGGCPLPASSPRGSMTHRGSEDPPASLCHFHRDVLGSTSKATSSPAAIRETSRPQFGAGLAATSGGEPQGNMVAKVATHCFQGHQPRPREIPKGSEGIAHQQCLRDIENSLLLTSLHHGEMEDTLGVTGRNTQKCSSVASSVEGSREPARQAWLDRGMAMDGEMRKAASELQDMRDQLVGECNITKGLRHVCKIAGQQGTAEVDTSKLVQFDLGAEYGMEDKLRIAKKVLVVLDTDLA